MSRHITIELTEDGIVEFEALKKRMGDATARDVFIASLAILEEFLNKNPGAEEQFKSAFKELNEQ